MTFNDKQPKFAVCASGRVMVCLNEREVKTIEQVPVSMDDDGEMEYREQEKAQYEYDVYWLDSVESNTEGAVLQAAIASVIAEITAYDKSTDVNSFILNGELQWLDYELRSRIYDGNERLKLIGREDTTLWLGSKCITMPIDIAQLLISKVEAYAKDCYNVTAKHKAAVQSLNDIGDVLNYDYKLDYPTKINLTV